jgi:hypothetical protein
MGPPYAEFRFIYRSREILLSKGVIEETAEVKTTNQPPSKKRKTKSKKSTTPKKDVLEPSLMTTSPIESPITPVTPLKPRAKKARMTPKPHVKTEYASPIRQSPLRHESPRTETYSDLHPSPISPALQRRQSHPNNHPGILNWVESQPPPEDTDILQELRELRVSLQ